MLNTKKISLLAVGLAASNMAVFASAAPSDPILTIGGLGSYSEHRLDGRGFDDDDKSDLSEGGVFVDFGNKMTGQSGLIYQAGLQAKYGEKGHDEVKDVEADLDVGLRAAIDPVNFVDFIIGGGYGWNRYEPRADDLDVKFTSRSPFAKAAVGYNHKFDNATLRVELGARRTFDAEANIKASGNTSDDVDLKDRTSPYAELGMLLNQHGSLPVYVGGYYAYTEYKLKSDSGIADDAKLKRDEYGLKVGVAF